MKVQPLHPEHRFRRLILALRKTGWKAKLLPILVNGVVIVLWIINIITNRYQLSFIKVIINAIPFLVVGTILGFFMTYIIKYIQKKYSVILIPFWLDKLFDKYWICYLLDYTLFDQQTSKENKIDKFLGRFNYSSPKPTATLKHSFADFFGYLQVIQLMTQKILALNPDARKTKLIKWISEDRIAEVQRFFVVYLGTVIPFVLIIVQITMNAQFNLLWVFIPMIIIMIIIIFIIILPPSIAKTTNIFVIKAILCALYLRDPEHEITDQRVLGIPAYINYKSLVQQVDSYMIDSTPPSGAEQL